MEEDKDHNGGGYVDSLLRVSLDLLRNGLVLEIQRQGFDLILHLWRFRVGDVCVAEFSTTNDDSDLMLYGTACVLPSKSAIFASMTEVAKSAGISSWNCLAPSVTFPSERGSTELSLCTSDFEGFPKYTDEKILATVGTVSCHHQDKGQLLRVEHIMLSKAFDVVASSPRTQNTESLLTGLLDNLNNIWTQPEWEDKYTRYKYCLIDLIADDEFTLSVHLLVKSFEKELSSRFVVSQGGCSSTSAPHFYSLALPKLMLPLILQVLKCVQICWEEPITYDLSGVTVESILLEEGMLSHFDEADMLKNSGTWLHGIRVTGYNIIGLCASLDGAFYGLLDRPFIINVLMKNLGSMEFNHLGKFIQLVLVPLVKCCPRECWDEWMLELLGPIFGYCEDIFYHAWFTFLHKGRAQVPRYFGILMGPDEIVVQFEKEILLQFTRSVSDLLLAIASERSSSELLGSELSLSPSQLKSCLKGDSQELKPMSLTGYLLHHNCLGKLSMYLFGCLADYQAARKALPFCCSLIDVAVATNYEWLHRFIRSEMLPTIFLLLDDFPSAISRLSSELNATTKEDARNDVTYLCQRIYEVFIDKEVVEDEGEVTKTLPICFEDWLAKKLTDLRTRAYCAPPDNFPKGSEWRWEFNEEFERYLPAYMDILIEVEAMDDCLQDNYLNFDILLEKLKPEFKSRYAINSYAHPCLQTMYPMLQRKIPAVYYQKRTEWTTLLLTKLIELKPYIKLTDIWENIFERLTENCGSHFDLMSCNPEWAVDIFLSILFFWEPQFHPLIREGHIELLKTIAKQLAFAEGSSLIEPLEPHPDDFLEHLRPYACIYIKRKKEESGYFKAEKQVRLHKDFDEDLASGALDHCMTEFTDSKDGFVHKLVTDFKKSSFELLDPDLIRMSLERRAKIVEWENQMSCFIDCLASLHNNDKIKNELGNIMSLLETEGFFRVDDDSIDWNKKSFSDSVEKFGEVLFSGKCIDKCFVIRGIMDYREISELRAVDWQHAVRRVVPSDYLWREHLRKLWMETGHYKHMYYDILAQPLQKVFLLGGALKLKSG